MKQQYLSTSNLCEIYGVTKEYFLRRKKKGEFIKNIHYIQKSNTLRWNKQAIENWWFGIIKKAELKDETVNNVLNKIIPNK